MRRRKKVMKVGNVLVKSVEQIEGIRESGKINTAVLDYVESHIQAGISTEEIDRWVYEETVRMGAIPEGDSERRRYHQCGCVYHLQRLFFGCIQNVLYRGSECG